MPAARQPIPEETKKQTVVGNILRGSLGNMVEWFDFYSFTVFGTYFAHHFFASGKEDENLLGVRAFSRRGLSCGRGEAGSSGATRTSAGAGRHSP